MNKPRNRQSKRQVLNCKVDPATLDTIRRIATGTGKSQSQVVDEAMKAYLTLEELWTIQICVNCKNEVTPEYGHCPLCGGKEFKENEK